MDVDLGQLESFLRGFGNVSMAAVGMFLIFALIKRDKAIDARVVTMLEEEKKLRDEHKSIADQLRQEMRDDQAKCAESLQRIGEKLDKVEDRERQCLQEKSDILTLALGLKDKLVTTEKRLARQLPPP